MIMDENRFFKWVWRFNSVIIAFAALLAIGIMLYVAYMMYQEVTRDRAIYDHSVVEVGDDIQQSWTLGSFSEVRGHNILLAPMMQDQRFKHTYYTKSAGSIRNFLFVNTETSAHHWLFDHSQFLIETRDHLSMGDCKSEHPVRAIVYLVIKQDTNNDGRLTMDDTKTLAITQPDGSGYQELVQGIDRYFEAKLLAEDEVLLLYEQKSVIHKKKFSLPDFTLLDESVIQGPSS